jgi:hypothetical protein
MITNMQFRNVTENGQVTGFQVRVRIPYYRGVFLSFLDDMRITVDGELFPPEKLKFSLGGRSYTLAEAHKVTDVHWDFGQYAALIASKPGGLSPGVHTVEVGMLVRSSYELPPELDPEGLFRQTGSGGPRREPTIEDRYKFTWNAPGVGKAIKKMTLVQ